MLLAYLLASTWAMSAVVGRSSDPTSRQMTYEKEDKITMKSHETSQLMAIGDRSSNLKYVMVIQGSMIWEDIKKQSLKVQEIYGMDTEKSPDKLTDGELAQLKQACHDGLKCVAANQLLVLLKQIKEPLIDDIVSVRRAITKITQVLTQYTTEYHEDVYQYEVVQQSDDQTKVYETVTTIVEDNKELCQIDLKPTTKQSHPKTVDRNTIPAVVNNNSAVNYNTTENYNINNGTINSVTINIEPHSGDSVEGDRSKYETPSVNRNAHGATTNDPTGGESITNGAKNNAHSKHSRPLDLAHDSRTTNQPVKTTDDQTKSAPRTTHYHHGKPTALPIVIPPEPSQKNGNITGPTHMAAEPTHMTARPTHMTAGPTHMATGPTHMATGPTHMTAGPTHMTAGPTHMATGPMHMVTGPTHMTAGPTHMATGPTHMTAGPTHMTAGPTHMATGPTHMIAGPTHMAAGPTHMATGPTHMTAGPTHMATGPTHMIAGPTHMTAGPPINPSRPPTMKLKARCKLHTITTPSPENGDITGNDSAAKIDTHNSGHKRKHLHLSQSVHHEPAANNKIVLNNTSAKNASDRIPIEYRTADGVNNNTVELDNSLGCKGGGKNDSDSDIVSAGSHNKHSARKGLTEDGYLNNGNMKVKNIDNSNRKKGTIEGAKANNDIINVGTTNNGPVNYGTSKNYNNNKNILDEDSDDISQDVDEIDKTYSTILKEFSKM
ncbi:hypothetical protein QTP88_013620 [Uroleucon formosanum]